MQEDQKTVYPGDHTLDDPALLEMLPPRSQRELDLEALDYHSQGYTVRQIGKLQDVHANTAFNRLKRGREIDARDPLRAEGASLHAQVNKLRRLERAIFPAAVAGDLRSVQTVLRIWDRLVRLGKLAGERQSQAAGSQAAAGKEAAGKTAVGTAPLPPELLTMLRGGATIGATVANKTWAAEVLADEALLPWDFMLEMLPHREAEIAALREEFSGVIAADEENWRKQQASSGEPDSVGEPDCLELPGRLGNATQINGGRAPSRSDDRPAARPEDARREIGRQADMLDNFMAEYARPGFVSQPSVEQNRRQRPLTRKEKALQARARREQRVGAPLARRELEINATTNSIAKGANSENGANASASRDGPLPVAE